MAKEAIFMVELLAFTEGKDKKVVVPEKYAIGDEKILNYVYLFGQNELEGPSATTPSLSMGDVIHMKGKPYLIRDYGFRQLSNNEYQAYLAMDRGERIRSKFLKNPSPKKEDQNHKPGAIKVEVKSMVERKLEA